MLPNYKSATCQHNCVCICKTITSRILFKAPTGHRTASGQRLFVYRTTCCDRWTLVSTLHLFYLTSALRLIRLITASFSRNYTESACEVTHFAGCRPTSPTEHSGSVLTITYLVRYGCNTEFPRAACWPPYSSLYTVLACRKCS